MRCGVELAAIRAAPNEDSEQVTQALYGEPLDLRQRRGGWAHVRTSYDYDGWLLEAALDDGPGALPDPNGLPPLETALSLIGAPYLWGGLSSGGIDCSGLVHLAHRLSGTLVPRDAWQQEEAATRVAEAGLVAGDLVTYGAGLRADHVAFWLGDDKILHATSRDGLGVVEEREPASLRATRRALVRF